MSTERHMLLGLLSERSVKHGETILSSGERSDWYIDVRLTSMCSIGYNLIGAVLKQATAELGFDAVGGPETGAIPLTGAMIGAWRPERYLEGFWVRKAPKLHGSQQLIEGRLQSGMRVIVVDDVLTTGQSTLRAVDAVRSRGCEVVAVVSLVDRLAGASDRMAEHGIPTYKAVYTIKDFNL